MIGPVLQHCDLQRVCRPDPAAPAPSLATLEKWARKIKLPYSYDGHGGIWTTVDALNAALGIKPAANDDDKPYEPGIL